MAKDCVRREEGFKERSSEPSQGRSLTDVRYKKDLEQTPALQRPTGTCKSVTESQRFKSRLYRWRLPSYLNGVLRDINTGKADGSQWWSRMSCNAISKEMAAAPFGFFTRQLSDPRGHCPTQPGTGTQQDPSVKGPQSHTLPMTPPPPILLKVTRGLTHSEMWKQQEQDPTNLYISNLPVTMDEQELENMLKPFGHVISTRILRDANGVSRGVGFARMESTEKCEVVIQHFNGKYLKTPPGIPGGSKYLDVSNRSSVNVKGP
ncbi:unnamed protein product, partial [Coregonus sp. 'balchen']